MSGLQDAPQIIAELWRARGVSGLTDEPFGPILTRSKKVCAMWQGHPDPQNLHPLSASTDRKMCGVLPRILARGPLCAPVASPKLSPHPRTRPALPPLWSRHLPDHQVRTTWITALSLASSDQSCEVPGISSRNAPTYECVDTGKIAPNITSAPHARHLPIMVRL